MKENNLTFIQILASWPEILTDIPSHHDLEDPKSTTEWKTINLPQERVHYLKIHNRRHFDQAQGTPFAVPPLSQCFDWSANSPISDLDLQGDYTNNEIDDITQLFLRHCKAGPIDHKIGVKITQEWWKSRVRAWQEATTTSPSGCHLGHFKALVHRHSLPLDTDKGQELLGKQNDLVDAHTGMLQYALDKRYSHTRWQNIFNIASCGKTFSPCPRDELKYDMCYCSRKSCINFDNDAASCYNQILPNVSSLVARKKVLHKNVTFVHAQTLKEAKYRLKTALGVSNEYYQHCTTFLIYSSGQEATNSPGIWLTICSTIGDIYEQSANGAEFISPDK
eukprot:13319954-Ditylum_brightwellii.AAC.1